MEKRQKSILLKWLLLVALLVYVGLAASWAYSYVQEQPCQGIEVSIDSNSPLSECITPESVKLELGPLLKTYASRPLSSINTDSIERRLARVNNFEHVECYISSDAKLHIKVVPMLPEARIFSDKDSYYINRDGKRIDARYEYYADVPVVYGNFSARMPAKNVLPVVHAIARDSLLKSMVTMIEYRSPQNIILIPRMRGHVVNIGDTSNLDRKFANLLLMYRKVMPYKGWELYDTISVKFAGQIVATRRDKTHLPHSPENIEDEDVEEAALASTDLTSTGNEQPKTDSAAASQRVGEPIATVHAAKEAKANKPKPQI